MKESLAHMKSIMIFDPKDSEEETKRAWRDWYEHNQGSAIADKHVPTVEETMQFLALYR